MAALLASENAALLDAHDLRARDAGEALGDRRTQLQPSRSLLLNIGFFGIGRDNSIERNLKAKRNGSS